MQTVMERLYVGAETKRRSLSICMSQLVQCVRIGIFRAVVLVWPGLKLCHVRVDYGFNWLQEVHAQLKAMETTIPLSN